MLALMSDLAVVMIDTDAALAAAAVIGDLAEIARALPRASEAARAASAAFERAFAEGAETRWRDALLASAAVLRAAVGVDHRDVQRALIRLAAFVAENRDLRGEA